jgi:hypothetical protein
MCEGCGGIGVSLVTRVHELRGRLGTLTWIEPCPRCHRAGPGPVPLTLAPEPSTAEPALARDPGDLSTGCARSIRHAAGSRRHGRARARPGRCESPRRA